ncbi:MULTISPECIES: BrnT family toxin [unclassified Aureimonas]|uniref:BrnT family toxin n=1 Tax=unclassified Aureimonas TaxID=2615206 RepID=UPI0009EC8FCC|nr:MULTISPECIES: BrnT family toxin [unclassified Aureimonas]
MRIGFDESKRVSNLIKHGGLDFKDIDRSFFDSGKIAIAKSGRLMAIGPFRGRLISIVFTRLGTESLSIVSMRPASRKERRFYEDTVT